MKTLTELDYRESDGIEISLLWDRAADDVVAVFDPRTADRLEFGVEPSKALDAFQHPFAYAP